MMSGSWLWFMIEAAAVAAGSAFLVRWRKIGLLLACVLGYVVVGPAGVAAAGFGAASYLYLRRSGRKSAAVLGAMFAAIHAASVGLLAVWVLLDKTGEVFMMFLFYYAFDRPVALLYDVAQKPFLSLFGAAAAADPSEFVNFYYPAFFFGVVGSLQYAGVGALVAWLYRRHVRAQGAAAAVIKSEPAAHSEEPGPG